MKIAARGRIALMLALACAPCLGHAAEAWQLRDRSAGAGLPSESFNQVLALSDGHLLLPSFYAPPHLFDGHGFRPLPLHGPDAARLIGSSAALELEDGQIWFGTRQRGLVRRLPDGEVRAVALDLAGTAVLDVRVLLRARDGGLLIGTSHGVFRCADPLRAPDRLLPPSGARAVAAVTALHEDATGTLWIGTERGLFRSGLDAAERVPEARLDTFIWSIRADADGDLWVGTRGSGLARFAQGRWRYFDTRSGFPHDVVRQSVHLPGQVRWVATAGGGLVRLQDERIDARFDARSGLSGDSVTELFADPVGGLWTVGPGSGLQHVRASPLQRWTRADGLPSGFVWSLLEEADGDMLVGTNAGLARIGAGATEDLGRPGPGYQSVVRALLERPNGALLVGTDDGAFRYNGTRFDAIPGSAGEPVLGLLALPEGDVLLAGDSLRRLRPDGRLQAFEPAPPRVRINALVRGPDQALELLTAGHGLLRLGQTGWEAVGRSGEAPRLRLQWIDPDGRRWLGGDELGWLDEGGHYHPLQDFARRNARGVHAAIEDGLGALWVSGNGGLFRFEIEALRRHAEGLAPEPLPERLDRSDGLPGTEFNGGSQDPVLRARDGALWFAGTGGVTRLDPGRAVPVPDPLRAVVLDLEANDRALPARSGVALAAGTRRVGLRYSALPAWSGGEARFAYRLLPVLPEWIDASEARQALFPGLGPGQYRFELRALLPGRSEHSETALAFSIEPAFWERRGIQIAAALLVLLAAAALPAGHILALRRQRRRLLDEVAEKTDELRRLAETDALTGLANRRRFDAELGARLRRAGAGLLLVDVDHFKRFNDALGHAEGDRSLQRVAAALQRALHGGADLAARLGGEEFALLVDPATPQALDAAATRLRQELAQEALPHPDSPTAARVTVSIGLALGASGSDAGTLLRRADAALYRAKAGGRDRAEYAD